MNIKNNKKESHSSINFEYILIDIILKFKIFS